MAEHEHTDHIVTHDLATSRFRRDGEQVPGPSSALSRLLVVGDTHGNIDWIGRMSKLATRHGCEGVIQLGDFGFWPDQRIWRTERRIVINDGWIDAVAVCAATHNVWWRVIDGNHDAHPLARGAYRADPNGVRPIRTVLDHADRGAVWSWGEVRFGALGGAISIDRYVRSEGHSYWRTEEITDDEVDTLIDRAGPDGVDVLFTHDAPSLPPGIRPLSDPALRADCERSHAQIARAVDVLRPQLLVHGHYHLRYSGLFGRTRIEGLASDLESHLFGHSWCVLELPSLAILGAEASRK